MNQFILRALASVVAISCGGVYGYEIPNHADMTQRALLISKLGTDVGSTGKLFRLGLKPLALTDPKQVFPRYPVGVDIRECFGERKEGGPFGASGAVTQDPNIAQPIAPDKYQVVQLLRYGGCFEDNVDGVAGTYRVLSHFYDPQHGGQGLSLGLLPQQPSSPDWAINGGSGSALTGVNHLSYNDARSAFYAAVTSPSKAARDQAWGTTFQTLGHVVHHLQDMAQPQHVRNDGHCDSVPCALSGAYNPSGYEKLLNTSRFVTVVQSLAQTATTPILFGLPREFWSASDNLVSYATASQGMAAYTNTNFVSAGTNFQYSPTSSSTGVPAPATNFAFPIPSPTATETIDIGSLVGITNANAPPRLKVICPDVSKCAVNFYGSTAQPSSRKSSVSIYRQDLVLGVTSALGYANQFAQNPFTYAATATDLIPKSVEYSAGLINYFFRGEMAIRLPVDGVYGLLDGGDPLSNCKDTCGFRKLKVRVQNTTAPINGIPQNFTGGTMMAIVKFSRNNCYTADFASDPGALYPFNASCFVPGGAPVEEQVTADPIPAPFSLASGSEVALTLNFTTPIPVNAWNVKLQFVYRGQLGQEPDGVAVATRLLSSPTPLRYMNEYDYLLINQQLYSRADVNASQTLLNLVVPTSCVTGAAGSKSLAAGCFNPQTIPTSWTGANGAVLASLTALPTNTHALWVYIADFNGNVSASFPAPSGAVASYSLFVRDRIYLDSTSQVFGDLLINWRGLQTFYALSRYYLASTDTTPAPLSVSNLRPPFPTTTPIKMTSFNF